jgi:hypothetical protein
MVRGPQPGLKEARPAHAGDGVTSQVAHGGQCDVHDAQLIQVVRLLAGKTEAELRAEFDALDADGSGALYPPGRLPNSPARGLAPPPHSCLPYSRVRVLLGVCSSTAEARTTQP